MRRARGFTLIELTIVATIMALIAGFVIVRWGTFSNRQQAVACARQLGNTLCQYRERAQGEQCLYAVALDLDTHRYAVYRTLDRNPAMIQDLQSLKTSAWSEPVHFEKVFQDNQSLASPVFIYLDAKGILSNLRIEIQSGQHKVTLSPDAIVNENHYDEQDQ